jgi:hypothetical protein
MATRLAVIRSRGLTTTFVNGRSRALSEFAGLRVACGVDGRAPMLTRSAFLGLALLTAATVVEPATAVAQPEVRDHRASPSPQTTVVQPAPRYRRRPGPRFMMPLKVDLGAAFADTSRGVAPGLGAAVGIHWASLSPRPTDLDIGLGVFGALLVAPEDPQTMSEAGVAYGGAYLEVGHTLARGSFWRTWAAGRAEYLGSTAFDQDHVGFGAAARVSAELYASGVGIEPRGVFLGTYSIGVFAEAGMRDTAPGLSKLQGNIGLTFRTPLVFAP